MAPNQVWQRTMLRVGFYDLGIVAPVAVVWVLLGVVDIGVLLGLTLARMLAWALDLRAALARAAGVGSASEDPELIAAEAALRRTYPRFTLGYGLGWILLYVALVALARAELPGPRDSGSAELAIAGLILVALLVAGSALLQPVLRSAMHARQLEIGAELLARKIETQLPERSLGTSLMTIIFAQSFGCIIGVSALGAMLYIHNQRELSVAEQRHRVELQAQLGGEDPGELELLTTETLPELLRAEIDHAEPGASIGAYDPRNQRALAAIALAPEAGPEAQRWLVASHPHDENLVEIVVGLVVLTLLGSLPAVPAGGALSQSFTEPIDGINEATERFVEGSELGALRRIVPVQGDELGRLARNFNAMLDMLEELAGAATAVAQGNLRVELEHPGELHDAFRAMLAQLHEMVAKIREASLELASTAAEIHAITQQQESAAEQQSAGVQQVSVMVSSLASAAEDITAAALEVLGNAEMASETSDEMVAKIGELSAKTNSVGELLDVIRDVAERSDLLALNGSLEATRAGEAGRGFALVAGEMRRLAERVKGTVGDVHTQIAAIRASGSSTVLATEQSRNLAQSTAEAARTISTVTQQQSDETEQASHNVQAVAEMVVRTAAATSQTRAAAEGLRAQAIELERLTGQFIVDPDRE